MCLDDTSLSWPAASNELWAASWSPGQTIKTSGPLALAAWFLNSRLRFAVTLPPFQAREILSVTSQSLPMGSIIPSLLFSSNLAPPHHLPEASARSECKVILSALNFKVCLCRQEKRSHSFIYLYIYFSFCCLLTTKSKESITLCMLYFILATEFNAIK